MTFLKLSARFLLSVSFLFSYHSSFAQLEELIVTAELIDTSVLELPNSVTVINDEVIEKRGARQLEDLLNLAPNVNYASGASRGRFVQVRGIGERSEFQEPIINSVGVVLDGIDLTGISLAASTMDLKQVEVLRGPQGTLYGANALAGLVNMVSNDPSDEFYGNVNVAVEEYGGIELGGVTSAKISDNIGYRLAIKHFSSDGFTDNVFLQRDDTNNIKETSARLKFVWQATENLKFTETLFLADADNGYDAFSLDNTRQTYSDRPGKDAQKTVGYALNTDYQVDDHNRVEALISVADSELEYSYDEDWSHPQICAGTACDVSLWGFDWSYASTDQYLRDNQNTSVDLRWSHESDELNSVLGIYHRDQDIDLTRRYTFNSRNFTSRLNTKNTAIYGQLTASLNTQWSLIAGLRGEQRDNDYQDSSGAQANPDENLWGGRIALEYRASDNDFFYGLVSRGYKPGGFNLDQSISGEQREFDTETMLNFELGYKGALLNDALQLQLALFYQDRDDIQSKQSIVRSIATGELGGVCPCSFTDFTDNATSGSNKGIELELNYQFSDVLNFNAAIGLLNTEFDDFLTFEHINADRDVGRAFNLKGREQAHAPSYQFVLGADWSLSDHWVLSGSIEGKDAFYFSDRHEEQSDAYELVNLELAYHADNWTVAVYGRNVTDELVKTRGFGSFGNDPRKFYAREPYNQFAAPRVIGMRAKFEF